MSEEIYFGVKKTKKYFLDKEKTQWIEFKKLNEGELAQYEDSVGGKVVMDSQTQKAEVENKTGSDRRELVKLSVCGLSVKVQDEKTVSDVSKWDELYESMDSDKAKELYSEIKDFNGIGKKK